MLNKQHFLISVGLFIVLLTGFTTPYTAPTYNEVNFSLCSGYTPPTYNEVNFTLSLSEACDTCTCPGLNKDWEIDLGDYCVISDDCDLGTGTLSFVNSGNATCDATIDSTDMEEPGAGGILYIDTSCMLNID